jgi:hypothetical protein
MEMNLEDIEQRHQRTKLIRAVFRGVISLWIDDVDWLIAEVKRLREENHRLQGGSDCYIATRKHDNEGGRG